VALYGALVSGVPMAVPSIWNSTLATPPSACALALGVSVPVRPVTSAAGAVSVTAGGPALTGGGVVAEVSLSPPPPQAATSKAVTSAAEQRRKRGEACLGAILPRRRCSV